MPALQLDITIEQGATFQREFTLTDSAGVAFSLAGYTVRGKIRDNAGTETVSFTASASTNKLLIELTATQTAALAFRGASAQTQASQSEALAAVLRFAGATTQAQAAQAQALQALLAIRGQVTQSQAIQIAALTAIQILDITGTGTQMQEAQRQAVSDFVEELIAILTITARDPLALTVTDSDPLALDVTVADPLALTITRTL